jgi:hypothetical protein
MRTATLSSTEWIGEGDRRALAAEVRRTRQPNQLVHLSIGEIAPTPAERNSRGSYDDASLDEMAASIREHGILQPILVRPLPRHEAEEWKIVINGEEPHPSYVAWTRWSRPSRETAIGLATGPPPRSPSQRPDSSPRPRPGRWA